MKDEKFWHKKWESDEIGFHRNEFHPSLEKFWPKLRLSLKSTVLVPLCGKSKDMMFLRDYGHSVFGVELSEIAIKDFAAENKLPFTALPKGDFINYVGSGYSLLVGDFFKTSARAGLRNIAAVYDRAALVALPTDIRGEYVAHLKTLLKAEAKILLITLEYDQSEMSGPPFSVDENEVESLFSDWCEIENLHTSDPEMFKGKVSMIEKVYALTVK